MAYQFRGHHEYFDAAAIARGFDPTNATDKQERLTLLASNVRNHRLMVQVADALGQASTAKPEHRAAIAQRAIDILWQLTVMKEATEAALLDLFTALELPTEPLMEVMDHAARHSDSNDDQRVINDVGTTEDGRTQARPRQAGDSKRR